MFDFAVVAISSIVAVMNPISTAAVFLSLTGGKNIEENKKIATKVVKLGFIILGFFALTGTLLFQVFNIQMYAFQIAGGILLITIALKMLSPSDGFSANGKGDISIIPLTIPLTAGPGTITTTILVFSQATNIFEIIFVFLAIGVGLLLSYVGMVYGYRLFSLLGKTGIQVATSLMAIIVLAIAIQFIISGIIAVIPHIPAS